MVCKPDLHLHDKLDRVQCAISSFCAFLLWKAISFCLSLRMCSNAHLTQKKSLLLSQSIWRFQKGRFCRAYSSNVACRLFICIHIHSLSLVHTLYDIKFIFREEGQIFLSWILLKIEHIIPLMPSLINLKKKYIQFQCSKQDMVLQCA